MIITTSDRTVHDGFAAAQFAAYRQDFSLSLVLQVKGVNSDGALMAFLYAFSGACGAVVDRCSSKVVDMMLTENALASVRVI